MFFKVLQNSLAYHQPLFSLGFYIYRETVPLNIISHIDSTCVIGTNKYPSYHHIDPPGKSYGPREVICLIVALFKQILNLIKNWQSMRFQISEFRLFTVYIDYLSGTYS